MRAGVTLPTVCNLAADTTAMRSRNIGVPFAGITATNAVNQSVVTDSVDLGVVASMPISGSYATDIRKIKYIGARR